MTEAITNRSNERFIDDDPTVDDLLGRRDIAINLASLIANAPSGSSFRLGIYGGWGEGKTSIMRMMELRLNAADIGTAFVLPWMANDANSLTTDIVDAIAEAIGFRARPILRKATGAAGSSLAEGWTELSATDWKLKVLDKTIVAAIRKGTGKLEEWQDGKLLKSIKEHLQDKKLVVFIDDVDRTDPALVPKMLLNIREALSLPNLFYVIGLSPAVVQEGLKDAHPGYSDALRFLEKIVEYPFFLPLLDATDCAQFTQAFASDDDSIDRDVLTSIGSLLPRNPRQLKLFVRTLALLAPVFRRFDRDEISLSAAYLVQLLTLEFPHASRVLASRNADIEWIEKYEVREISARINARQGRTPQLDAATTTEPSAAAEIDDHAGRKRFIELCSAIGTRMPIVSNYGVRELMALTHQPPLLTWKEFLAIVAEARSRGEVGALRDWIEKDDPVASRNRQRVLFRKTVQYRSRVWGGVVDASTQAEIDPLLDELDAGMKLLTAEVDELRGFANDILTAEEWSLMQRHFAETSRFVRPRDLYSARRAEETKLIAHSLDDAPYGIKGDVFLLLQEPDYSDVIEARPVAYRKTIESIRRDCEEAVAEALVNRFQLPDGAEMLWKEGSPERNLAFDDGSLFHHRRFRRQLYEVLKGSPSDAAVQKNALTFLRMINHGALSSNSSLPKASCRRLLDDHVFLEKLWRAATSKRLNFRNVGSLRQQRKELIGKLNVPEKRLPLPKWWRAFEKDFQQIDSAAS